MLCHGNARNESNVEVQSCFWRPKLTKCTQTGPVRFSAFKIRSGPVRVSFEIRLKIRSGLGFVHPWPALSGPQAPTQEEQRIASISLVNLRNYVVLIIAGVNQFLFISHEICSEPFI